MPAALPLQDRISQATQGQTQYRILENHYGNGYSQRAQDGYNAQIATWNIDWGILSTTDMTTIITAIDTAGGVDYFTWTPPGESVSKKWIVKTRTMSSQSANLFQVTCTLDQVFDL
jgi:phage-related protein